MTVIVCLDDRGGMAFNHRRQSRDRVVLDDMVQTSAGHALWMSPASARLFAGQDVPGLRAAEDFLDRAGAEDFCFVEDRPVLPWRARIRGVVLYRWGRVYPADLRFDLPLDSGDWALERCTVFAGHSHKTITKEVYRRCNE